MADWGYERHNGPAVWTLKYSDAGGRYQSPVDIITSEAQESSDLTERPLTWNYGSQICKSVVNTGRGWRVDVTGDDSVLSGGPLEHTYQLAQFHCHWGKTSDCGSEHTVDGDSYAAELHFVHWNKDLYPSCSAAVAAKNGLAVLGVFLKLGEENSEVEKLAQAVANAKFKDQSSELPADFDPSLMFPADQSYWTYDGSLTTPPCHESVTWIVFKNPIEVTETQLECFRDLRSYCDGDDCPSGDFQGKCVQNFRPPQPLNDRCILDCVYR